MFITLEYLINSYALHETIILYFEAKKNNIKKDKTIASRILSFVLLILIIYILQNKNFSLKIYEKKYAIQYIRKLLIQMNIIFAIINFLILV